MNQDRRQYLIDVIHDYLGVESRTMSDADLEAAFKRLQQQHKELR